MKKYSIRVAIFILPFFVWVTLALTNESFAGDHYRVGTLNESYHYRDDDEFNSSHDGIYIAHNRNVFGTYHNSEYEQSIFYARNHPINKTFSYSYGFVLGYEFGLVPMVALSAQLSVVKFTFTHEAAVIGLEFPLL